MGMTQLGDSKWTVWLVFPVYVRENWERNIERLAVITLILDCQVSNFEKFRK